MHLPVERNSFIDRERDVGVLTRQLNMGAHRLVTLTGPYGVGKSRLALRIASQLRAEFADGVWWINLTDVTDSVLVPQSVAVVLHLPEQAEEMLVARLQDRLFARHLLLILDGCDHVINACAELVQTLLAACADLHIVVTTRQPLGIEGESVWTVGPLPISPLELPDPLDEATLPSLLLFSGIRLFVERAQAAQPAFQLTPDNARAVVEVCHYLDGIPLALELAAQRVKVMAVQQMPAWRHDILGLLEGVSPKSLSPHPSLRAALDYSYDHLGSEEQRTLSALSIFEDGATFEAIQWVCGEDVPALAVLDTLSRLVDKSLITLVEHRGVATYRMLEVMRQYCRAKLDASGETDTLHRRQATFYATLAEQADRELQGPKQALWLGRLEREHTHLRAALTWVMEQGETALLLRLAGHLWRFWEARGHIAEGRQWLEQSLTLVEASSSLDYARALHGAAVLAHNQSDLSRARWLHEACLALRHQLDDRQGSAVSLLSLGLVAKDEGDHERAASLYQESLGLFRRLNDSRGAAEALLHMGLLAHIRGNAQQATPMIEESLALFRRVEDKRGMALALSNLGLVTRNQGRYQRAQRLHEEALALRRELDDKVGIALSLANLGLVAQDQGHFAEAVRNQEQSLARFRELGAQWGIALLLNTLALAAIYQEDYDQAAALSRESWELYHTMGHQWGIAMVLTTLARIDLHDGAPQRAIERVQQSIQVRQNIHDSHGLAECLETLAIVWASQGHGEQAMWLDGAATALREQIHAPRSPTERAELNHWFEGVYPNSNEAALMLAWDEGHYTSVEQAIETALALILTSPSQVNAASSPSLDPPVEPELRIYALGRAEVYRGDTLLTSSDWKYAKAKELLFFLLSRDARTKEQIGVMVWPEASSSQLRSAFHPTLHHLRRALGQFDWVVQSGKAYAFNRTRAYWYDVEAFEKGIVEARRLQSVQPDEAIRHLQAAVELYQGDFLEGFLDAEWITLRRGELERTYFEAMLLLGRLMSDASRYLEAADVYRAILSRDNYQEAAHRGLMRSYAAVGERARAILHYQQLVKTLYKDLGASPAPETTALYERISRGQTL